MTQTLLIVIIILISILIFIVIRKRSVEPNEIQGIVSSTWLKLGLEEKITKVTLFAQDIRDSHKSIEQMLKVPIERGALGEISLETILSDQLPPTMFGVRKTVFDGKVPDAHIRSTAGIICIDAKFPLENYRKMVDVQEQDQKIQLQGLFRRDIRFHLNKIAKDYICPDKGSADFAFAYIPSEGVYYYLISEEFELLNSYVKKGVQVVSPLTFSHKVELIKAGVFARKLSEEAEIIRADLNAISKNFNEVDALWKIFYGSHFKNASERAEELDRAYRKLRNEFDRIYTKPEK